MLAIDLITKSVPVLLTSDSIRKAQDRMNELHVSHLPIVNETELLGLVSELDFLEQNDAETPVGSLSLSLLLGFIYDDQPVFDVIKIMSEQKLSLLPVIDQKKTYLGCISLADLLDKMEVITSAGQPGGIIVLELNERDLSLVEVLKIVESNNAHVLSLFTESIHDSTQVLLTLKLNKTDINPIIATFERYKYQIRFAFQNDSFRDDTLDRYEAFMNYLKM